MKNKKMYACVCSFQVIIMTLAYRQTFHFYVNVQAIHLNVFQRGSYEMLIALQGIYIYSLVQS